MLGNSGTCLESEHLGGRGRLVSVNSIPAWSARARGLQELVPGQLLLYRETLSHQTKNKQTKNRIRYRG